VPVLSIFPLVQRQFKKPKKKGETKREKIKLEKKRKKKTLRKRKEKTNKQKQTNKQTNKQKNRKKGERRRGRKKKQPTASHPSMKGQRPQERWIGVHFMVPLHSSILPLCLLI